MHSALKKNIHDIMGDCAAATLNHQDISRARRHFQFETFGNYYYYYFVNV